MRSAVVETRYFTAEVWGAYGVQLFYCAHRHPSHESAAVCARQAEIRLQAHGYKVGSG